MSLRIPAAKLAPLKDLPVAPHAGLVVAALLPVVVVALGDRVLRAARCAALRRR